MSEILQFFVQLVVSGSIYCLHDMLRIPKNRISVEISSWVKPEVKLLLPVSLALAEDISVKDIRITTQIPQELKVNLIPS